MPPARPASLKVRALQWLAQREHSRQELRDKLLRMLQRGQRAAEAGSAAADTADTAQGDAPLPDTFRNDRADRADLQAGMQAEVDTLLQWLEDHGHLSDTRFVETRVHARQARYGNQRIRQELRQHGIALDAQAQQSLAASEFDRANALWQRKYGEPATDAASRLRQMRFLAGRGFSLDVVQRVLKQGGNRDGNGGSGSVHG